MKQLIDKRFFERNTNYGVERYLSRLGLDLNEPYETIPGPTSKEVYVVSGDDIPKPVVVADDGTDDLLKLVKAVGGIPKHVAGLLIKAGYGTVTRIKSAGDDDLIAIRGISKKRVDAIRAVLAH